VVIDERLAKQQVDDIPERPKAGRVSRSSKSRVAMATNTFLGPARVYSGILRPLSFIISVRGAVAHRPAAASPLEAPDVGSTQR